MTWQPAPADPWVRDVNRGAVPLLSDEYGPPLDADDLLGEARARTGLDDFGDFDGGGFEEPLRVLVRALETEGRLNLLGRYEVRQQILRLLEVRLHLARYLGDDPGVLDEPIDAPLFVTGAPRTGTSILHALLSRDPANRVPESWEFLRPVPPPDPATRDTDPRIALVTRELRLTAMIAPGFDAMHERGARMPKECISAQAIAFRSEDFPGKFRVPSYAAWLASCDMGPAYRAHRVVLQVLQRRTGSAGRRWVLKAPPHLGTLDALFATYPDARVAVTHRDPLKVLGSLGSLLATIHATHSDAVDAPELAGTQVDFYADVLARYTTLRRDGKADPAVFHDSHYADFLTDPLGTVEALYAHFGLPLDDGARAAMAAYLADRPRGKHGAHSYALGDFGLDAEALRPRFADYQAYFAVPEEGGRA
ncbi:sulfotransferase family protein [Yinghuangia sp. YIM S09857]|uniref:sulfotransferase family protein n=1 Tax=Yinghuangia sp. YIM S09857 TaxID=3436929 RepID=UPI003F53D204